MIFILQILKSKNVRKEMLIKMEIEQCYFPQVFLLCDHDHIVERVNFTGKSWSHDFLCTCQKSFICSKSAIQNDINTEEFLQKSSVNFLWLKVLSTKKEKWSAVC